jgi:predicted DNA-binding transcriptional regulator YafY
MKPKPKPSRKQHPPPKIPSLPHSTTPPLQHSNTPTLQPPSVSRNAADRMQKIHQLIAAGKYPNAIQLARQFEVDKKTILRDLEWMKTNKGAPIAYDRARHGFYYTEPFENFLGVPTISEAEIVAVLFASKAIEHYQATPFHKPMQMALKKMAAVLDRSIRYSLQDVDSIISFRHFAPEVLDAEKFEAVARALQQKRSLRFEYKKPGEDVLLRHFHPYQLTCWENLWYIIGYDEDRDDYRTFVLGRITGPVTVGEKFQKRADFNPQRLLRDSFGMMKGDGDYEIVIEFDRWAADLVRERLWHTSQKITDLPKNGGCHLRLRLSGLEEIERWILSWGTHATVIKPEILAQRVGNIARQLSKRYPQNDSVAAP